MIAEAIRTAMFEWGVELIKTVFVIVGVVAGLGFLALLSAWRPFR